MNLYEYMNRSFDLAMRDMLNYRDDVSIEDLDDAYRGELHVTKRSYRQHKSGLNETIRSELDKLCDSLSHEYGDVTILSKDSNRKQVIFKDNHGNVFCAQLSNEATAPKSKSTLKKVTTKTMDPEKNLYQYKTKTDTSMGHEWLADNATIYKYTDQL